MITILLFENSSKNKIFANINEKLITRTNSLVIKLKNIVSICILIKEFVFF